MPNFPAFPTLNYGPYGPVTPGSSTDPKPAVLTANFGGRYSQRTGDGINALPKDFNFKSVALSPDEMAQLTAFLEWRRGYLPFTYLVPNEATPRQFICSKWSEEHTYQQHSVLTAQFEENFDP